MDSSEKDSGRLAGHMNWHPLSPFDLSRILPVGGGLLVPHSLRGPPVARYLMHMVTVVPGQGGWFQPVVLLPSSRPFVSPMLMALYSLPYPPASRIISGGLNLLRVQVRAGSRTWLSQVVSKSTSTTGRRETHQRHSCVGLCL